MDEDFDWRGELPCPSFTMVPDVVFDSILPHLAGGEWKVLAYLIRQTYGWHRRATQLPLEEICAGAGVSRRTAVEALRAFEQKGMVLIHRSTTRFGKEQNTYELRIASDPKYSSKGGESARGQPKSKKYPSEGQNSADQDVQNLAVPSSSTTDTRTERAPSPPRRTQKTRPTPTAEEVRLSNAKWGLCVTCGCKPCAC
jgi:hypothetical protein